jgi:putative membrane protein insertion efficiency factor
MADQAKPGRSARALLKAIGAYQGVRRHQASPCRFIPSCSTYAMEAIEEHGAVKGGSIAIWRVMRCNPIGGHGIDLVPLKVGEHQC